MVTFVPNWVATDSTMSSQNLMSAYAVGSNPTYPNGAEPPGMFVQGFDPSLGIGQFIYCEASAGVNAGDVCELTQTLYSVGTSISLIHSVQEWQGVANSGKPLCVALATLTTGQFGWFQVYGAALVNSSGAVAAASSAYWNAAGSVKVAAVASKQANGFTALVANSASFGQGVSGVTPAISATQSVWFLNGPTAQGAIT
jgi:hypothetical protein